jgi:tyrosinase
MDSILDEPNFNLFASEPASALRPPIGYGTLEATPHNSVHGFVGGIMASFQSPRDPIFWMHHNMIERVWWDWNGVRGNANTNDTTWTNLSLGGMFVDRNGAVVNDLTVGLLNLAPLISYRFDSDPFTSCVLDIRPWVIADEVALRKLLEEGGKVELRRSQVLARVGQFDVPVGTSAMRALSAPNAAAMAGATRRGNQRLLLRIAPAEQPATGDFFVRVFVGLPSAGPNTSTDIPQYAGSFAFFNDPDAHGHHAAAGTESNAAFVVDVGATLERLRASGATLGGALDINLVVVPQSGLDSRTRRLRVRSLELQLAESSTPAPRPLGAPAAR